MYIFYCKENVLSYNLRKNLTICKQSLLFSGKYAILKAPKERTVPMKRKPSEKKICPACEKEPDALHRDCPDCNACMNLSKNEYYKTFSPGKKAIFYISLLPAAAQALLSVGFILLFILPVLFQMAHSTLSQILLVSVTLLLPFLALLPFGCALLIHKDRSVIGAAVSLAVAIILLFQRNLSDGFFQVLLCITTFTPFLQTVLWGLFHWEYRNYANPKQ